MKVSRIDLADAGSPEKLVMEILKVEPVLPIPVPVEKLALALDIEGITTLEADGFIGGLITDDAKSRGVILVKEGLPEGRRRFTVGHELAHFLIPTHKPGGAGRFLCSMDDLLASDPKVVDQRLRWEAEANRFASLILLPPPMFRKDARATREPDLQDIVRLGRRYQVSKEACGRAYIDFRDERLALLITHEGRLLRSYRNTAFRFLSISRGAPLPPESLLLRGRHELGIASDVVSGDVSSWFDVTRGTSAPALFEQVYLQRGGYAIVLLWLEDTDADADEEEENEIARRWAAPSFRR